MKFHLDENVPHAVAEGLERHGHDVTTCTEVGMIGAEDEEQLSFCLLHERVILTQDRDMLRLASHGISHAGIAYWQANSRSIGEIIRQLLHFAATTTSDEMQNRVMFL